MNEKSFLIGYDEEEIDAFLPYELRKDSLNLEMSHSDAFNIGGKG